jgi:hypothetical protein
MGGAGIPAAEHCAKIQGGFFPLKMEARGPPHTRIGQDGRETAVDAKLFEVGRLHGNENADAGRP